MCVKQAYQQGKDNLHQALQQYKEKLSLLKGNQVNNQMIQDYVFSLINDLCSNGRHVKTSILCSSHALYEGQKTSELLNNMTDTILYPLTSGEHHIHYFCKQYLGMTKNKIEMLRQLRSRWVLVHKNDPRYFMYDHGVMRFDLIA